MNIKVIIILIPCLIAAMQARRFLQNTLEPRVNFFYKVNFKIHVITNRLLISLRVDKNVTNSNHFKMLLAMHSSFNRMSENNYKVYKEVKDVSCANFKETYRNKKHFDELLQDVVEKSVGILGNHAIKLANRTFNSKLSSNITKSNETEYFQENFIEMWSKLSERITEMMIDLIISEKMGQHISNLSYNTFVYNETGDLFKKIEKTWSQLSDKSAEIIIDSIINENISPDVPELSKNYDKEENETRDLFANFDELLSKLSDKTIENIIDPIISEGKRPGATEFSIISGSSSRELETWHLDNITRRIYKGKRAKIKNYPFVASLHLMSEFLCVGSIISMDMVLTAASCLQIAYKNKLFRSDPRTLFVRIGSDRTKRSGKLIPIIQVIFHPKYDPVTLKHNIAIVKMLKKLRHLKKRSIKKIKIDKIADDLPNSVKEITILGWGARGAKDKLKSWQRLTSAHLDIYDITDCKEVYSKYYVTDTNFCAGFTYKGGGACTGDVGGPAVVAEELVGVVSFGPIVCGMPDTPTVFTKIGYYAQWIDGVLNQKSAKTKPNTKAITQNNSNIHIPLYTTVSHTKRNVSHAKHTVSRTKHYVSHLKQSHTTRTVTHLDRAVFHTKSEHKRFTERAHTYGKEEIKIFKKFISDFISGNHSIIDYLSSSDIDESEKEFFTENFPERKEKIYFDLVYRPTIAYDTVYSNKVTKSNDLGVYKSDKVFNKLKTAQPKYPNYLRKRPTMPQVTNITKTTRRHQLDFDVPPTKLATFVESIEFQEDDLSGYLDVESLLSDDSSYYEAEIPIEDTLFRTGPPKANKLVTYNHQIDLIHFMGNKRMTTTEMNHFNELVTKSRTKPNVSFNIHYKPELTNSGDDENLQSQYNEREIHNTYHKSEFGSIDNDRRLRPDKNIYHKLNTSDSSDASKDIVVHFVTGENPSKSSKKALNSDEISEQGRGTRITVSAPKGKTVAISLEDFNYDYDQKQLGEKDNY